MFKKLDSGSRADVRLNLVDLHFVFFLLQLMFLRDMSSQTCPGGHLCLTERTVVADSLNVIALNMILQVAFLPERLLASTTQPWL